MSHILRKLWIAFRLICPNCEQGRTFKGGLFSYQGLFTPEEKCAFCDVRFERSQGESIGGVFIALTLSEVLSVGGFFLFEFLFAPSMAFQIAFWFAFIILFTVFSYRHFRSLWVGISYLTGGVTLDEDAPSRNVITPDPPEQLNG